MKQKLSFLVLVSLFAVSQVSRSVYGLAIGDLSGGLSGASTGDLTVLSEEDSASSDELTVLSEEEKEELGGDIEFGRLNFVCIARSEFGRGGAAAQGCSLREARDEALRSCRFRTHSPCVIVRCKPLF